MAIETVSGLTELTSPAANDEIGIWDVSAGEYKKIQQSNLVGATITGGGTLATGGYTLTVPATGTAALLATANVFTTTQRITSATAGGTLLELYNTTSNAANRNWRIGLNLSVYGDFHIQTGVTEGGAPSSTRLSISPLGYIGIPTLAGSGNRAVYSDPDGYLTNSSSDARLKTDVVPITADEALRLVGELVPVRYNWIDHARRGAQREIGLVAQEVGAHVPEVIGVNADETLSIDYAKLTALLIGAVQELTSRVAALEAAQA